jgi:hypothetical protein
VHSRFLFFFCFCLFVLFCCEWYLPSTLHSCLYRVCVCVCYWSRLLPTMMSTVQHDGLGTSPIRSRTLRPGSGVSRLNPSQRSSSSDGSELREQNLNRIRGSGAQSLVGSNSASYDGSRLPSLVESSNSSHGSVVASLTDNFIPGKTQRQSAQQMPPSESSGSYIDYCGWAVANIEADTADPRLAIKPARGGKKSAVQQLPQKKKDENLVLVAAQGSVRNPLARPSSVVNPPSPSKRTLSASGRKRSVRVNAPPEQPKPTKSAIAQPPQQQFELLRNDPFSTPANVREITLQRQQQNCMLAMQAQQQLLQMQYFQQQQQQRLLRPTPLNENFANVDHQRLQYQQQHSEQQASSPSAHLHIVSNYSSLAGSSHTNTSLANDSTRAASPTSQQRSTMSKTSSNKKRGFLFCAGKKQDVAADNRSTLSSSSLLS